MTMTPKQAEALKLWRDNEKCYQTVADLLGKARSTVRQLIQRAEHWENASPGHLDALAVTGLDIGNARHGWRIIVDPVTGSRDSVFWKKDPDLQEESVNVAQAMKESLKSIPPHPVIPSPNITSADLCNFIPLADLHVGGEYGDQEYVDTVFETIDTLVSRLPVASKAVLIDLGDLLDANDHHGLTPASGNNVDVIREDHLKNTIDAMAMMRRAILRLASTHNSVEVHLLRGNHDETSYIGVMMALYYYFQNNPQINIVMSDDNFRVIPWGECAVFPHHGDKAKWADLKNVFADQFPDEWAAAKYWRFIWTGHFHHDRQNEMIGAMGEQFRTLSAPNDWAMKKGLFSRGGLQGVTLHRKLGEVGRTKVNLKPLLLQDRPPQDMLA